MGAPIEEIDPADRSLFDHILSYICDVLAEAKLTGLDGRAVATLLSARQFVEAEKLLNPAMKQNAVADCVFMALAVVNAEQRHFVAAERYANQAAKLHELLGGNLQASLFAAYGEALHDLVSDRKMKRIASRGRELRSYPTRHQLQRADAVEKYVLHGLVPDEPLIEKSTPIVTMGSCFAGEMSRYLQARGFNLLKLTSGYRSDFATASLSEDVFNTYTLRTLVEMGFGICESTTGVFELLNHHNHQQNVPIDLLKKTFGRAEVFIMTLGLAEVCVDKHTGAVLNSTGLTDGHDFRLTDAQENLDNIDTVYRIIRDANPHAVIVFTLSPVPLNATFRAIGSVVASGVSKAILRVAIDELMRRHPADRRLFYFPSYEIITSYLPGTGQQAFQADQRHVTEEGVDFVMKTFADHFLIDGSA